MQQNLIYQCVKCISEFIDRIKTKNDIKNKLNMLSEFDFQGVFAIYTVNFLLRCINLNKKLIAEINNEKYNAYVCTRNIIIDIFLVHNKFQHIITCTQKMDIS